MFAKNASRNVKKNIGNTSYNLMDESQRNDLFLQILKSLFSRNLKKVLNAEPKVGIQKITTKEFKEKLDSTSSGFAYLCSLTEIDHEVSYFFSESSVDLLVKKGTPEKEVALSNAFSEIDLEVSLLLSGKPKTPESDEIIYYQPSRILKKYPEQISEEIVWLSDRGKIFAITNSNLTFYFFIKEELYERVVVDKISLLIQDSTFSSKIKSVVQTRLLISNPTEFMMGMYILPFTAKVNQYEISIRFLEFLYFNSLNMNQKFGICYKQTLKIESTTYINYFFIHLNSPAEVKSYSASLFEIFSQLHLSSIDFLKKELPTNSIGNELLVEVDSATIMGKKFGLFKTDLKITKNHLSLFLMVDPAYILYLSSKGLQATEVKQLKALGSYPLLVYALNSAYLHKHIQNYAEFSYPLPDNSAPTKDTVKKFLLMARFINLIDTRDLMVLVQNYFVQNYKTADLVALFYYSVINPSTKIRKNSSLLEFDEKRFTRFLVGVHIEEFEFQKTKEAKSIDFLYDHNLKLFLELGQALKSDKLILSEKGYHVYYNIFMEYYKESKKEELDLLGNLDDYIKTVKEFPKKFASEMINELSKEVVCISYIEDRRALDFLSGFMSKNRKDQMYEDFQYYKKQFKDKKIDILDIYDARKILFQKYNELKEALKDEGMI
jgi:hypothetical protein